MEPASTLYTRQQVIALAALDDTTLNYWSREGLLVPTEGGHGRGSHRRFDFVQVNIAAILGQLRRFGLGLGVMRSFADLLQSAARLGASHDLHAGNFYAAASLATRLDKFDSGQAVMVPLHGFDAERPAGLSGQAYSDWLMVKRPAADEAEIIDDRLGRRTDYDSIEAIVAAARSMGPGRETEAEIYANLVYQILAPGYADAFSWLLGFGPDDTWKIEFGFEGGHFFDRGDGPSSEEFGAGIFLPVSGIIRRTWGLKSAAALMRDRQARLLEERLAEAGIAAHVTPAGPGQSDGFTVEAPGTDWDEVQAILSKLGYGPPQPAEADQA